MKSQAEAILKHWRQLGQPPVDARVLREIQEQLLSDFAGDATTSPARIARVIAGDGGELRHPEVIELDAEWRQSEVDRQAGMITGLEPLISGQPLTLRDAEKILTRLETLRRQHERTGEEEKLAQLRSLAIEARRQAQSLARNSTDESLCVEQTEVSEWLKVWLQTPNLFEDWLELRKRSAEFRSTFAVLNHQDTKAQRS